MRMRIKLFRRLPFVVLLMLASTGAFAEDSKVETDWQLKYLEAQVEVAELKQANVQLQVDLQLYKEKLAELISAVSFNRQPATGQELQKAQAELKEYKAKPSD